MNVFNSDFSISTPVGRNTMIRVILRASMTTRIMLLIGTEREIQITSMWLDDVKPERVESHFQADKYAQWSTGESGTHGLVVNYSYYRT